MLNPPPPAGVVVYERTFKPQGREEALAEVERTLTAVKEALLGCTDEVTLSGQITLVDREKK